MLELKNIRKWYGHSEILNDANLEINEGSFNAIMGSSGSGKTTILNIASGLAMPDNGIVKINGKNIASIKEPQLTKFRAKHISYIFQDFALLDFLNVYDNVTFLLKINKMTIDRQRVQDIIESVGLRGREERFIDNLSGGQKQCVAIARALASNSQIIFADEPTGSLDVHTGKKVMKLLKDAKEKYGKTIIMVTHDPEVAAYADAVHFLSDKSFVTTIENPTSEVVAKKLMEVENAAVESGGDVS